MESLKKLDDYATEGLSLLSEHKVTDAHYEYERWVDNVSEHLKEHFPGTGLTAEWVGLGSSLLVTPGGYDTSPEIWFHFTKIVQSRIKWLSQVPQKVSRPKASMNDNIPTYDKDKVFIVHGHNNEHKETISRFIEKIGLQAIILHEQPNVGKTIIEKIEKYSRVGYAIVLLTADDRGKSKDDIDDNFKLRARQNVIFELGYFIGLLGREKVCALYENDVEIPSDYSGILFVKLDQFSNWKMELLRELKAAGYKIDINKIL